MPEIVHDSHSDCIYAVDSKKFPRDMIKLTMTNFPQLIDSCRAFAQISHSDSESDRVGTPQAFFESMDTIKRFSQDIFIAHRFALIRLTNCYYNSESISLKVHRVRSILLS